ncbi:hypothetical protein HJA82_29515 [Rhizobium bangladeshense]|uniref:hypothetical protein n=1 Tax=Rhizobium bangladeshense TaxID=1138189 RepID=UPI001C839A64|nr:hypothetical protein [Rhizobium bangladeshense]MBX4911455.1 hypothetical protein [Rhizobium bangladeshense]
MAEQATPTFTEDDLEVRVHVQLGFSLTLGLYDGPITRGQLAAHVRNMIETSGAEQFIEKIEIMELSLEDGTSLVSAEE